MIKLNSKTIELLKQGKNLLAFSAGVDSTALFFLLLQEGIEFDIAIVNYGLRKEAILEVEYAKELVAKYKKDIFIANAPKFNSNFEANARDFRYNFFTKTIQENSYTSLLMAHQLNDKLEWLLMRLSTGAGVVELSGMQEISQFKGYQIVRPLLHCTKEELEIFLTTQNIKYFIDKTNFDTKYQRNHYRPIVNELLKDGKGGYLKSFEILEYESQIIKSNYEIVFKEKELRVAKLSSQKYLPYATSYILKELGYLISGKEREELKIKTSIVAGRKWAIEFKENLLYIAPYIECTMPKEIKEKFRKTKIPPKVRCYIYKEKIYL